MDATSDSAPELAASHSSATIYSSRRWTIVFLLFTVSMINYFDRASISIALPKIAQELSLGPMAKGILLSAFFWSYASMQIPIGWCADRFNLRWLYAGAFLLWSIAQGMTAFVTGLASLICLRILLGIGESIYLPGGTKVVSLLFPPSQCGLPFGLFDFGTRTGLVLEGLLVPWMINHLGWRETFAAIGFSALLWLIPWLLITPTQLRNPTPQKKGPPLKKVLTLLSSRNLLGICLGFFCFDYYWYFLVTWLPDYLVTVRHFTLLRAGIFSSLPYLVFGVSEPVGGFLADHLITRGWSATRTRKTIVTVAFLSGLFLIPAAQSASPYRAVAFIMGGCLVGLATGNLLVIVQCCAPADEVALWVGIENFVGNLGGILAPLITGKVIERTGSYSPAFALAAGLLITGIFAYWLIVGQLKVPENCPQI